MGMFDPHPRASVRNSEKAESGEAYLYGITVTPDMFGNAYVVSFASHFLLSFCWLSFFPSKANKHALTSSPPANPVNLPVEPTTQWHGAIMEMGFFPLAAPTARAALFLLICFAICP